MGTLNETKYCNMCKQTKSIDDFNKSKTTKDGHDATCRECRKIWRNKNRTKISEDGKKYREKNNKAVKAKNEKWRKSHRGHGTTYYKTRLASDSEFKKRYCEYQRQYKKNNKPTKQKTELQLWAENNQDFVLFVDLGIKERNKERQLYRNRLKQREQYKLNPDKHRKEYSDKYHSDPAFRLNERLKSQFRKCLIKDRAMGKYYKLLGYNEYELKDHLESKFKPGMSFENMGKWHVDHVKPKSWFNLLNEDGTINEEEIKKCWALDNLQPLWAKENISKNNRYIG